MPANTNNGCLGVLLPFLNLLFGKQQAQQLPYRLRDDFLSAAEYSFYKVLSLALESRYCIQCKVRLEDIFFVVGKQDRMRYQNRINQKHVDFLICDAVTMKPMFDIELDDSSHVRQKRRFRDAFVEDVFRAAGFPLLRVPVKGSYHVSEIKDAISPFLQKWVQAPPVLGVAGPHFCATSNEVAPICPKCNIPMVLKTATQGSRKGKQFYGCKNFSRCQEAKPL